MDFQRTAMQFHQVFRQCQSDAETAPGSLQRGINLRKHLKDARNLVRGEADTGIAHPKGDMTRDK